MNKKRGNFSSPDRTVDWELKWGEWESWKRVNIEQKQAHRCHRTHAWMKSDANLIALNDEKTTTTRVRLRHWDRRVWAGVEGARRRWTNISMSSWMSFKQRRRRRHSTLMTRREKKIHKIRKWKSLGKNSSISLGPFACVWFSLSPSRPRLSMKFHLATFTYVRSWYWHKSHLSVGARSWNWAFFISIQWLCRSRFSMLWLLFLSLCCQKRQGSSRRGEMSLPKRQWKRAGRGKRRLCSLTRDRKKNIFYFQ